MLNINEQGVLNDLKVIRNNLNSASLEDSVKTLQLLTKSMNFLIERKSDTDSEKDWNDTSRLKYNLGRHFVDIIRQYNERVLLIINEKYRTLEDNNNVNINNINNCSINSPIIPQNNNSKINENKPDNQNSNGINSSNSISSNYSSYPPSPNVSGNNFRRNATYSSDITKNIKNDNNDSINRSCTTPANITSSITPSNITASPLPTSNDSIDIAPVRDTGDEPANSVYNNSEYYPSPSIMSNNNIQDEDEG